MVRNAKLEILKVISEPSRYHLLKLITVARKEYCVNELAHSIDSTHSSTSHHLSKLEKLNILKSKKNGREVCYVFSDSKEAEITKEILLLLEI